jgi:hypothetical protein
LDSGEGSGCRRTRSGSFDSSSCFLVFAFTSSCTLPLLMSVLAMAICCCFFGTKKLASKSSLGLATRGGTTMGRMSVEGWERLGDCVRSESSAIVSLVGNAARVLSPPVEPYQFLDDLVSPPRRNPVVRSSNQPDQVLLFWEIFDAVLAARVRESEGILRIDCLI